ncbi:tRNA preQ1(34) S-adenosylmethionine ribosyltransferase-isomerase QueA [Candidatus Falkowbacteria bacterium]|nr:tRNA preQ1(34) S-adenosylmethionine ribosyltransferase-isomerase QueA [Candidatus Falkowbacteria bacterium]
MRLSEFDFNLPKNLIAQKPASPRDACRLMVLDREKGSINHDRFYNLGEYLRPGDVLVLNNSKVLPARLMGKKETGGKVEILLLKQISPASWECLVGSVPVAKQVGLKIKFGGKLVGEITKRAGDTAIIKFNLSGTKLMEQILKIGQPPTPPYIKRLAKGAEYQTVFAEKLGSVAAPTAGMHFTKKLLAKLKKMGVQIEYITLHVGLGTFQPVKENDITKHKIHSEYFELDKKTAERLNVAKRDDRRIIACGTTTVRVLEHCARQEGKLQAQKGYTNIFIYPHTKIFGVGVYPGYKFKFIDALLTNFHVPRSTLIMLVAAFAGKKFVDKAYQIAIKKRYRFYSFGDSMLIV